ncbi:hypothetical protein MMC17_001737 [Xylographa soralifera]|nr:hypothetical protein [Xylographa soralifera]
MLAAFFPAFLYARYVESDEFSVMLARGRIRTASGYARVIVRAAVVRPIKHAFLVFKADELFYLFLSSHIPNTTIPSNTAAYQTAAKANPLKIGPAPYTSPGSNEIVIKNAAVAINPVDWMLQAQGDFLFSWIEYPAIFGTDVAGEVVEVGQGVTLFKVGDRVLGHAQGTDKIFNTSAKNGAAHGAFQHYVVLQAHMASKIPSTLSYEDAAVIPLGLSTAACGLFQKDQLALQLPDPSGHAKPTGKTLIVWGGSTSVGSSTIQLAVAAGYEVITTASPRNFDYVKKLGASQVFDYNSKTVVADIIRTLQGKTIAGAYTVGFGAAEACLDILDKCKGKKFIAMATYPTPQTPPKRWVVPTIALSFVSGIINIWVKSKTRSIGWKFIFGSTLSENEVGPAIYTDFLPAALERGTYVAAPEAYIVGTGLEHIQAAFNLQSKGMSARKVVVSL